MHPYILQYTLKIHHRLLFFVSVVSPVASFLPSASLPDLRTPSLLKKQTRSLGWHLLTAPHSAAVQQPLWASQIWVSLGVYVEPKLVFIPASAPVVSFSPEVGTATRVPAEALPSSSSLLISPVMNGHVPFQQAGQVERGRGAVCCAPAASWLLSKLLQPLSTGHCVFICVFSSWWTAYKVFSGYA